jgi:hypothetical protein
VLFEINRVSQLLSELPEPHVWDFSGSFFYMFLSVIKPTLCVGCCLRSISSLSLTVLAWQHFVSVLLDYFCFFLFGYLVGNPYFAFLQAK